MPAVPRGERLVITLVGRRNVGKSSLINGITGQNIAIVSEFAGTTTDPVKKNYELIPIGPVMFYDTAGLDDEGKLGEMRIKATQKVLWRSDIALIVTDQNGITDYEKEIIKKIDKMGISYMVVFNKSDINEPDEESLKYCEDRDILYEIVSTERDDGIYDLKESLISIVPEYFKQEKVIVGDLVKGGDFVVLVVPIDLAAPKGRLILPQVQVIRELLDHDAIALTVKEREIEAVFNKLNSPPALVITDSQVVLKVAGDVPESVPFTTFSTLFARYKGDIEVLVKGANKIDKLKDGDKILIAESCSHHVQSDDIGRVKIPRWIRQYCGKDLTFDVVSGNDFPEELEQYSLVIHCGGCMITGLQYKRRIRECNMKGVPITNYGISISKVHGVLDRVIAPFFNNKVPEYLK